MIIYPSQRAELPRGIGAVLRIHSRRGDPFLAVRIAADNSAMPWHVVHRGSKMSENGILKYPLIEVLKSGYDETESEAS